MLSSGTNTSGSGSPSRNLAKFGCLNCRAHHLKCDRVTPKCGRCLHAKTECLPPGLKLKLAKFKHTKKQKWVKIPKRLLFTDETKKIAQDASSPDSEPEEEADSSWSSPLAISDDTPQETPQFPASNPPDRGRWDPPLLAGQRSPSDRFIMSAPPKWPLSDPGEAYLVRHFVQKLAVWLDLCDPNRSFEYEVPERARSYPILLNAILALSARHLAETGAPEYEQCALHYNEACLKDLRNNLGCGWSEEVFAAAIILQVVAEMDCPADGEVELEPPLTLSPTGRPSVGLSEEYRSIKDGHLCGIHSFVKQGNLTPGTLAAASFWVGLRQEIYRAVMVGRMVKLNLEHPLVDRSPLDEMPAKDYYAWANRAVVHCADVLNFCYSLESMEATEWNKHQKRRWLELHSWNCEWEEKKPTSFNPCHKGRGAGPFQAIWYLRSCQVIGIQHHLLAKLFLLDRGLEKGAPIPDNGYPVDERIRDIVRQICGIGLGNQWTAPSMFTACMAIAAFGEKYFSALSHHSELRAMLKILCDTQRDHGRSTKEVQTKLGNIVGWSDEGRLQNLKAEPNIPYKCEA